MAQRFQFIPPGDEITNGKNWKHLLDNIQQKEFDPFYNTTPATEGFSDVDSYWGYYFLFGPICFFSVTLIPTGGNAVTWTAGAAILLPYAASYRGPTYLLEEAKSFPATNPGHTGTVADWFVLAPTSILADNGHGAHGGNEKMQVSGWYFRE